MPDTPRITRRPEGGFNVELPDHGSYTLMGWFDDFDSAADWASDNVDFFQHFMEREGSDFVVSDPPCVSIPNDGWSMNRRYRYST